MKRFNRALATALLFAAGIYAQTSRGTVTGLVTDQTASVVPNAMVELKSGTTGTSRSSQTNSAGLYRFDAVDPGDYSVTVTASGFKAAKTNSFAVAGAQVASVDVKLEVGSQTSVVEVTAEAVALQMDSPVRSSTLNNKQIDELPIASRNAVSLALTVPGVSTSRFGVGGGGSFSVNGARNRSNNFLIDGTENNDISVAGQAFQITLPDLVQEASVQTSNYDAEFGRAGGAVVNVITRSGTNAFHGTASWLLDVTNDDAITNTQSLDPDVQRRGKPAPGNENIYAGTFGGPLRKNKTFFFGGFQDDRQRSSGTSTAAAPSAAGWATLNSLFPSGSNPRVDVYRTVLAGTTATAQYSNIALGNGRPDVQFGTATIGYANFAEDRLYSIKGDHNFSDRDLMSARYSQQYKPALPASVSYPGMNTSQINNYKNVIVTETHTFSPSFTNELRLGYNRIDLAFPVDTINPLGKTLLNYSIAGLPAANITQLGVATNLPQGRVANNYTVQDTVSITRGRHTFRTGLDILKQRSRQFAPINERGSLSYQASSTNVNGVVQAFTGFANFVDNFSGSNGSANRDFGNPAYYPELLRQQYFFTDRWRVNNALTLSLGVRYEDFGTPINSVKFPVYGGLFNVDPKTLNGPWNTPGKVDADKNNFGPSLGIAWSPSKTSDDLWARLLGDKKSVIRTGYQIGFDSFYNNLASNAATSSPNVNAVARPFPASGTAPRGQAAFSDNFPIGGQLTPNTSQSLVPKNLVNPYYQKWSFGIQRELKGNALLDVAYVGTKGTKLFMTEDLNPLVPAALQILPAGYTLAQLPFNSGRYDPLQGSRGIRTNGGSSYYHSLQASMNRRFANHFSSTMAYTWAKAIDYVSDPFSTSGINVLATSAVPTIFGGLPREKGLSLFDRKQRFVVTGNYELPFMKSQKGPLGRVLGGWQVSGIYAIESGVPFTVVNGFDADGIGGANDRPDVNPSGQKGVRAVPNAASPTGYINPEAGNAPIDPKNAQYVVLPSNSGRTGNAGRNTERTPITNNLNTNFFKTFVITERFRMELRTEMFNTLNHPQLGSASVSPFSPGAGTLSSNAGTGLAGRFLNPTFMDGGGRVIRYQLKLRF